MLMQQFLTPPRVAARNLLCRGIAGDALAVLGQHFRHGVIPRGTVLLAADARIDTLFFPESGVIAIETGAGADQVEIAVVGREGFVGWPALLGGMQAGHRAIVQGQDADMMALPLAPLRAAMRSNPALAATLLAFVHTVMVQMAGGVVAHLEHSLDQRVARWLLMRHDRIGGDQILVRHDEISDALGARRASVTDRLHILEGEHLVHCRRGRVSIRDRAALEAFAGGAYGAAEAEYRRLIAPFGKSAAIAS